MRMAIKNDPLGETSPARDASRLNVPAVTFADDPPSSSMGNTVPAQDDGVDIIDMTHLADPVAREPVDWMEVVALKSRCAPPQTDRQEPEILRVYLKTIFATLLCLQGRHGTLDGIHEARFIIGEAGDALMARLQ